MNNKKSKEVLDELSQDENARYLTELSIEEIKNL